MAELAFPSTNEIINQSPYYEMETRSSLFLQIDQIIKLSENKQHSMFKIAMAHFKKYIQDTYRAKTLVNEERFYFNELFYSISLNRLNGNVSHYLMFIDAIISVDLSSKQAKAVRIARDLLEIPPTTDEYPWEILEKALVWIYKYAGNSLESIISKFRLKIFEWTISYKSESKISALNLINIFFRNFPNALISNMEQVQSSILSSLQHEDKQVRAAGCHTLEIALTLSESSQQIHIQTLCVTISSYLVTSQDPQFSGFVDAVRSVIDAAPRFASVFTFADPPLHLISVDKPTNASLELVSLAYRCTPKLFKYEHITQMLTLYKKFIAKKSPSRLCALRTLGEFSFLASNRLHTLHSEAVQNLLQIICSTNTSSESAYAILSLLSPEDPKYQERMASVLSFPPDDLLVDGYVKYVELWPKHASSVKMELIPKLNEFINTKDPSKILLSFKALNNLKCTIEEMTVRLILQYANLLIHADKTVRSCISDFLLSHQDVDIGIPERLIVFVSAETNDELKLRVLRKIHLKSTEKQFVPLVYSMCHDTNIDICISAIKVLCNLSDTLQILSNLVNELFTNLKLSNTIDKFYIKQLLTIVNLKGVEPIKNKDKLTNLILEFPFQNTGSLRLLNSLIKSDVNIKNYNLLINHIKANIKLHLSPNRLNAVLTLLLTSMEKTDLLDFLWKSDLQIVPLLFELAHKIEEQTIKSLIIVIITKLGIIDPKIVQPLLNSKRDTVKNPANTFKPLSESIDPLVSLTYVSVSTALPLLMEIIGNDSLVTLHQYAVEALLTVMKNYRSIGEDLSNLMVSYIKEYLLNGGPSTISIILKNFPNFIIVLGQSFSDEVVPPTVDVICKYRGRLPSHTLLRATEWIATQLPDVLEPHIHRLTKLFLSSIKTVQNDIANDIFSVFVSLGSLVSIVDYLVIPAFLQYIESHIMDTTICGEMIVKLQSILTFIKDNGDFGHEILKTLLLVYQNNQDLRQRVINIFICFIILFRNHVLFLLPEITQVINLESDRYLNKILDCLNTNTEIPLALKNKFAPDPPAPQQRQSSQHFAMPRKLSNPTSFYTEPNFEVPSKDWTKTQWEKWYYETIPVFIRNSPSRAISACYQLAENHAHICSSLFPVAFAINILESKTITLSLDLMKNALISNDCPSFIVRLFLCSIELLEISGAPLPVKYKLLTHVANKMRQYHQALRYAEAAFDTDVEKLSQVIININKKLGLKYAANGVFRKLSRTKEEQDFNSNTYQFLGVWEDALRLWEKKLTIMPNNVILLNNKMTCLEYLSRFKDLEICSRGFSNKFSAVAAYGNGKLDDFMLHMKNVNLTPETSFLHAIYNFLNNDYEKTKECIKIFINTNVENTFPVLSGDFERSYHDFVQMTLVVELMEIVELKELEGTSFYEKRKERIMKNWDYRLKQVSFNGQSDYFSLLQIRSLYFKKEEMNKYWTDFLNTTIKQGQTQIALIALEKLPKEEAETIFLKSEMALYSGKVDEMIEGSLKALELCDNKSNLYCKISKSLGRVYLNKGCLKESFEHTKNALNLSKYNFKIWKLWSDVNIAIFEQSGYKDKDSLKATLEGLMMVLSLNPPVPMHSILRVFSILFKYGNTEIYDLFRKHLPNVPCQYIAEHLPQITAKLSYDSDLDKLLVDTLTYIGNNHPNVVLQAISVSFPYQVDRSEIIKTVIQKLKMSHHTLVEDSRICRNELVRVASSWFEIWCYAIDESSRLYLHQNDPKSAAKLLLQHHDKISNPPQSFLELSFKAQFAATLSKAHTLTQCYFEGKSGIESFHLAWQFYTGIYTSLQNQAQSIKSVILEDASPSLASFKSSLICVPGTYKFHGPNIGINSFDPVMNVFTSKQRPRAVSINATDGNKYKFLLKANEDTRLDQRVVQLLTFVNTIMASAMAGNLTTYSILPLAPNVGLIGWVRDSTTIYELMRDYRERRKIPLNVEINNTLQMCPNFEQLPAIERKESFEFGLSKTKGDDLQQIILVNSSDSSNWVSRRLVYTESLAATSMVGYILGLGDRHPGNIMMCVKTGKLLHIDFGDCFEVAQHREHYPETVPFRLTRVFVNALEIAKVEGTLRQCSINVMNLLRLHKDTISGLLETFVHDPLLMGTAKMSEEKQPDVLIRRIVAKLTGDDFPDKGNLCVEQQVDTLISEATSTLNICMMFKGWRPWW
ncbi:PIKK family atypical protein kinase [Trichomonas vaginalis G3]|uniref:non-specific serine/threonine protein kinase n=1 Tax=Trichomonas vaginalis (strain ATCC PRA-98 / G3) TaxID=412133 RepID=A2DWS3_TRIV3|nr:ataxia telangiectasia mutated (ATM) -related family [Trichomonas vaginalis G3]EAY15105.1 PIKK family atypical protein kinase [Trichomonas vaginalis G3]KAI5499203.1 ataxia telangiectasia mutated (ATM) -related family [Trichomonas vaginalis G3]|eukprot:XP_001327328.1 PIKK family atypical protein kinase [Trichomonas vaginalis G3]